MGPSYAAWTMATHAPRRRSLRVHVQEPAAAPRFGDPARGLGSDHGGAARHRRDCHEGRNDRFNENPTRLLTSGFTFVASSSTHDISFDTHTSQRAAIRPDATTNFRTPRYDLDAIYGLGPNTNPQFYDSNDRDKFLIVKRPYSQIDGTLKLPDGTNSKKVWDVMPDVVYDVPRVPANDPEGRPEGTAIISDPRNDQTEIILQLHVAFQMFHNKLVDTLRASGTPRSAVFEAARRLARWHYQWIVTHEFLPAIVGQSHVRLGVQGSVDRGSKDHSQVLQADEPRGALLYPGRVRRGRVSLRPQHDQASVHRPGCF
jgi:hypothetical protein